MSERVTLSSPDGEQRREVELSTGEIITIEDGPRTVHVTLENNGRLRVEMVDENKDLIEHEENNQPNHDNVNAFLGPKK